jgi:hypothetical protein
MREKLHEARAGGLRSAEGEPAGDEPGDGGTGAGAAAGSGASSAAPD